MKLKMAGLAISLACVAGQASAAEWLMTHSNRTVAIFIDRSTKTKVSGKQRAWFKFIYSPAANKAYDEQMAHIEFGCAEREYRDLLTILYKAGSVFDDQGAEASPKSVVPDSLADMLTNTACEPNPDYLEPLLPGQTPKEAAQRFFDTFKP